jgi:hypothetical protein
MRDGAVSTWIEWILVAMFLLGSAALFGVVSGRQDQGVALSDLGSPLACYQPWRGRSMTRLVWMPQQAWCRLPLA